MSTFLYHGFWTRELVVSRADCVFLFGDNLADAQTGYVPSRTQAVIRGLPNAIGIPTKRTRATDSSAYFTDADLAEFCKYVDSAVAKALASGKNIVIPADGIGTGKAQLKERAPLCFAYLSCSLRALIRMSKQQ